MPSRKRPRKPKVRKQPELIMETIPPVGLVDGENTILNFKEIDSSNWAILGENNEVCPYLSLIHVNLKSVGYGIYGIIDKLTMDHSEVDSQYYCLRGKIKRVESSHNKWKAGHSWRVYGLTDGGFSFKDTYDVDWIRAGGGPAAEGQWQLPFVNFKFQECQIKANHINCYRETHNVEFISCVIDCGDIGLWGGSTNIKFLACTKTDGSPLTWEDIKLGDDEDGSEVTQEIAIQRGITVA